MKTSNTIFSYNFEELCFKHQNKTIIWVRYSRIDHVKLVEDSL